MEEEEEESDEDAIERLKTEIGDRYDEETGRVATVQVSNGQSGFQEPTFHTSKFEHDLWAFWTIFYIRSCFLCIRSVLCELKDEKF